MALLSDTGSTRLTTAAMREGGALRHRLESKSKEKAASDNTRVWQESIRRSASSAADKASEST